MPTFELSDEQQGMLANLVSNELEDLESEEAELGDLLPEGKHLGPSDGRGHDTDGGGYQDQLKQVYKLLVGQPWDEPDLAETDDVDPGDV